MSARQLNRLGRSKGLDPSLGRDLNAESEVSEDGPSEDSEDESFLAPVGRKGASVISAAVSTINS